MRAFIFILFLIASTFSFAQNPFKNGFFPGIEYESKGHFYLKNHKGRDLFVTLKQLAIHVLRMEKYYLIPIRNEGRREP